MASATRRSHIQRLWNEYLRDPSQWWDNRKTKKNPNAPDFRHKVTRDCLWEKDVHKYGGRRDGSSEAQGPAYDVDWKAVEPHQTIHLGLCSPSSTQISSSELCSCTMQVCCTPQHAFSIYVGISKRGLESDSSIGTALLSQFLDIPDMTSAQYLFDRLQYRNIISWNSLILGYVICKATEIAFRLYNRMVEEDYLNPDCHTFSALLKCCSEQKNLEAGIYIHCELLKQGLSDRDDLICSGLAEMYAKCGCFWEAHEMLTRCLIRDVVPWTALMTAYVDNGYNGHALECFQHIQQNAMCLDAVLLVCALRACAAIRAIQVGRDIHNLITCMGLESNLFISNTLIAMFGKCCCMREAKHVFDRQYCTTVVSWNSLISGYVENSDYEAAIKSYKNMQDSGLSPDNITVVHVLRICAKMQDSVTAKEIQDTILKKGLEREIIIGNSLVDTLMKCCNFTDAQETFDSLPVRNIVSWNAIINGYAEYRDSEKALDMFKLMQREGIPADNVTFISCLRACGSIGALTQGVRIHLDATKKGCEMDSLLGNMLVYMYSKCGLVHEARAVFDKLQDHSLISWNALLTMYCSQHAENQKDDVFVLLSRMSGEGIDPNEITLMAILTACSHLGIVNHGLAVFQGFSRCLVLCLDHYNCVIDLLGRAGELGTMVMILNKMPYCPSTTSWHTVLAACQKWSNVEIGLQAVKNLIQFEEDNDAMYVILRGLYLKEEYNASN